MSFKLQKNIFLKDGNMNLKVRFFQGIKNQKTKIIDKIVF